MRKEQLSGDRIFVIHGFLSPGECEEHIDSSESIGYDEAPITTSLGFQMRKDIRNNTRVMLDAPQLAEALFEKAQPFLPERIGDWKLLGLNERFRYYRYERGQTFRPHYDGSFRRSDREMSLLTFMVYLNDGFEGGATVFHGAAGFTREILPEQGKALVFSHPQLHEGAPVVSGEKYVLRTDVMYAFAPVGPE